MIKPIPIPRLIKPTVTPIPITSGNTNNTNTAIFTNTNANTYVTNTDRTGTIPIAKLAGTLYSTFRRTPASPFLLSLPGSPSPPSCQRSSVVTFFTAISLINCISHLKHYISLSLDNCISHPAQWEFERGRRQCCLDWFRDILSPNLLSIHSKVFFMFFICQKILVHCV